MKNILLVLAVLITANFANAQDAKAKEILDKVSEKTRTYASIYAEFTFSMENKEMEIDEKNEGSIKLKGQKYCVQLPDVGVEVFINWVYCGCLSRSSNMEAWNIFQGFWRYLGGI